MPTKFYKLLISFIFFLSNDISYGCSCDDRGGFAYSSQHSELVVIGQVIDQGSMSPTGESKNSIPVKVKILKKLRGIERNETIIIHLGNAAGCERSPGSQGDVCLLALNQVSPSGEYIIFSCGSNQIERIGSLFIGDIYRSPWEKINYEKVDSINIGQVEEMINNPQDYPLTKNQYTFLKEEGGTYWDCDCPPLCSITNQDSLNIVLHKFIRSRTPFLLKGDKYLIHVKILFYKNHEDITFNGLFQSGFDIKEEVFLQFEKELKIELAKLKCWKEGSGLFNDVAYEAYIPILLKK